VSEPINRRKQLTVDLANASIDAIVSLIMGGLIGNMPWLAWGPIDSIIALIIKKSFKGIL